MITVIEQMSFYGACHYKNQHFLWNGWYQYGEMSTDSR